MKAHLVFIDESGLMMAPLVRRTWSPQGQTPLLHQRTCSHKKVSVIAALCIPPCRSRLRLYFRLHPDANINAQAVESFLKNLLKELSGAIIIVWDSFPPHRAIKIRQLCEKHRRLHICYFPAYAPELNPVENVWGHTKMNPMANMIALDIDTLAQQSRTTIRGLQRKQHLLRAFFRKAGLSLRLK